MAGAAAAAAARGGGFYTALALLRRRRRAAGRARRACGRSGRERALAARARGCAARARSRALRVGQPARLALGRHRGRLLHAEHRHALVAFGPPQSGKSAGLAVPALLEWEGPAVASSIKTDLLAATLAPPPRLGAVFVFDPFELVGPAGHTWSPLHGAGTWDGALEVAWRLAAAGELDQRGVEGGDFWAVAAEQRLAPLLYTAARRGAAWTASCAGPTVRARASCTRRSRSSPARPRTRTSWRTPTPPTTRVRAFETQADRTRSSIEATAQALLRAYRFAGCCARRASTEIKPDRLLDERATLYLIGDAKASKLLRPIFLALLSEIVDRAYERATLAGGRLELPLLLCLDEAGNVAPLPNLAEIASTAPSHNIQLVSIFHDLAQARSRYGPQAETVVNSHRARMLLPGVADLDTLRYFAGLVGDEEARDRLAHHRRGRRQPDEQPAAAAAGGGRGAASAARGPGAAAVRAPAAGAGRAADVVQRQASAEAGGAMSWPESEDCATTATGTTSTPRGPGGPTATTVLEEDAGGRRWPLTWRSLYPRERWLWFEQLWSDVCALRERYRLSVRSGWWEDDVQLEALAALAAWTDRYDSGEWDDPPGKLGLLFDLERVAGLLRDGLDPFHPERDRAAFLRHLLDLGCQPPPEGGAGRR